MLNLKILLPFVVITFVVIGGGFFAWQQFGTQKSLACTEEAKICPDGSGVGRTGPNCEFAACPLPRGQIKQALDFCLQQGKRYSIDSSRFLNFDADGEMEILGVCKGPGDFGMLLFVLDKKDSQYVPVLEKEGQVGQRYYTFQNLKTNDVDEDGIDEIIFEESAWYGGGGNSYVHLYAPKYQQWFWRDNWWAIDIGTGKRSEGVNFSPNLEAIDYGIFKEFLSKQ